MFTPEPEALVYDLPVLIKAATGAGGARIITMGASVEKQDQEGDIITQRALLDSAESFIRSGAIDLEHISETGARYGLNPKDYIIGRPLDVIDAGNLCTSVVAELNDSKFATRVWDSLHLPEPTVWRASVYGFPQPGGLHTNPNGRFLVTGFRWQSLAICRRPVCDAITEPVRVAKAEAFMKSQLDLGLLDEDIAALIKANDLAPAMTTALMRAPRDRFERLAHHDLHMVVAKNGCPHTAPGSICGHSVAGFRDHFQHCVGLDYDDADTHALALAHQLKHRVP